MEGPSALATATGAWAYGGGRMGSGSRGPDTTAMQRVRARMPRSVALAERASEATPCEEGVSCARRGDGKHPALNDDATGGQAGDVGHGQDGAHAGSGDTDVPTGGYTV